MGNWLSVSPDPLDGGPPSSRRSPPCTGTTRPEPSRYERRRRQDPGCRASPGNVVPITRASMETSPLVTHRASSAPSRVWASTSLILAASWPPPVVAKAVRNGLGRPTGSGISVIVVGEPVPGVRVADELGDVPFGIELFG